MEYKHLVCVTGVNNNKYYDMREMGDGTFEATYGRIGVTATKVTYPMSTTIWQSSGMTSRRSSIGSRSCWMSWPAR